jgi:type II secretory pathway pseudopilin PulG
VTVQERTARGFFIEIVAVVAILGFLSAIAIPNVGKLIGNGKIESYESELHNIQTAVTAMLTDSATGTLRPVGPTADMSQVQTSDTPPLVLTDYLVCLDEAIVKSGCTYTFTANGTVTQITP